MSTDTVAATATELDQLRAVGYFVREGLFSEEEIAAFEVDADRAVERAQAMPDGISKPGRIAFVNSGLEYPNADQKLIAFSTQPRVAQLARSVAGPDAEFFLYQMVYKFGHNPDPFPWHQDDSYTMSSKGYFSIWLAISDATVENGCLWVHPRRSLDRVAPFQQSALGKTCWSLDDPDQGVPLELKRGSAVVFTSMLMHKSGGNSSPHTRKGHIIAFLDRNSTIHGKPYTFFPFS